jgi:hypothetical protein
MSHDSELKHSSEANMRTVVIAVPYDAVEELQRDGLASPKPAFRGTGVEALVSIGTDSAALVTLLQAPDSIRAFAAWVRARCTRTKDTIEISARRGSQQLRLTVDGDIDVGVVADFLEAAFADRPSSKASRVHGSRSVED